MPIEATNLTREYTRGKTTFKAVQDASLILGPGDFFSIIGRSGSGKSTLLNMLAGLLKPTSGILAVEGQDTASWDDRTASEYRNSVIGFVPQGQSTLAGLTVLDNVRLPFHLLKKNGGSTEPALEALQKAGIAHLAEAYPRHLSGGALKRVALARALINRPAYILADEPTGDLDAQTTLEIMKLLKSIAENGTGILMVTHDLDTLDFGLRTYVMEAGRLSEQRKMHV